MERLYLERARAKIFLNDLEGALFDIDCAILIDNNGALYYHRGVLKMNLGATADALADFDVAIITSDSTYSDVFMNRAKVKLQLGDITGALQDCSYAIQLNSTSKELRMLRDSIELKVF
jgi:tetratricopeptide (TPR) repeat protein